MTQAWRADLEDFRRRKDDHFRSGRGPLKGAAVASFSGLSYFPPAPEWVFDVPLLSAKQQAEFRLDTSSGETRFMALVGSVSLPLPGAGNHELQVFAPLGEESPHSAFIPFRDQTSGADTYGAGRYVDAPVLAGPEGRTVHLDFNRAYHPYCAYDEGWTCPLPPRQNFLPFRIEAGERLP